MISFFTWTGIVLILAGWIALASQATKRMAQKEEMEKFAEKKMKMRIRRNYYLLAIAVGALLLAIALIL